MLIWIFFGLFIFLLVNECLNSVSDCLNFELVSIRIGQQTCFEHETFYYNFDFVFFFHLKHETFVFNNSFLKFFKKFEYMLV